MPRFKTADSNCVTRGYQIASIIVTLQCALLGATRVAAIEIVPIDRIGGTTRLSLSANGKVVVGVDTSSVAEPIMWTRDAGSVSLGQLAGHTGTGAVDVSADGSVVTGYGTPSPTSPTEAFRWTEAGGMVGLGSVPGNSGSAARAISGDGTTIVGYDGDHEVGFIWTAAGGLVALNPPFDATRSDAIDVSAEGSVAAVATEYRIAGGLTEKTRATIWTQQSGFQDLGPLPDGWNSTYPHRLSADGSVLLGTGGPEGFSVQGVPFLWSKDDGIIPLPMGKVLSHLDMTPDASVVTANQQIGDELIPLIWDQRHGTRQLHDVLIADHGFNPADLSFNYIRGISADMKTLLVVRWQAGSGYPVSVLYLDKPLVAPVPEPAGCSLALLGISLMCGFNRRFRN